VALTSARSSAEQTLPEAKQTKESVQDFELSITRALADQLEERLDALVLVALSAGTLAELISNRPGVYVLALDGKRVYVGKAAQSLQRRLRDHHKKLSGRERLSLNRVEFVGLYMNEDLDAVAPERQLIGRYKPPWNFNGFGNNDPGRRRDTTVVKHDHFDALYPIKLSYHLGQFDHVATLTDLLSVGKDRLPFVFRYDTTAPAQATYSKIPIHVTKEFDAEGLFELLIASLPPGWQLTALPGYAILYRETIDYPSALGWWRRDASGGVVRTAGAFKRDPGSAAVDAEGDH
jgi:hypothetical protein